MDDFVPTGLGETARSEWPKPPPPGTKPIDLLKPGSDIHSKVLEYCTKRLEESERAMSAFYARWRVNERKHQAYIKLPDYEQILKDYNDKESRPAQAISIVIPYTYAITSTIVTYLLHTFCGRRPMFQVGGYKDESIASARMMEQVLQYQSDHTRMIRQLSRFFTAGELYGLGVLRIGWKNQKGLRTSWSEVPKLSIFGRSLGSKLLPQRSVRTIYSGNEVEAVDPFMFFPDPRVPMTEVNRRGEYVFWRSYVGKADLKRGELDGTYKYVDAATPKVPNNQYFEDSSDRAIRASGEGTPGTMDSSARISNYYQFDQGTVEIIPRELGLGESTRPEKYLVTFLNKHQIIQCEPFDSDHGMHPVAVIEPYEVGYGFGNLGIVDYTAPLQDTLSFLANSHIHNIRSFLNNMLVVDPSMVEMQDLRNPDAGKLIRLKRAAYGQDVRQAVYQLQMQDVTRGNIQDMEMLLRIGQFLTAISENLMGVQDGGGRKTATEVRTSGEAAASRLAAHARIVSAQGLVDTTEQMAVNTQQYLDDAFYIELVGEEGKKHRLRVDPTKLNGDFHYPVSDGTLPLDRVAMLDIWKEIFIAVGKDPQLRQSYSLPKIFEWVAELGGARNIETMRVAVTPDATAGQAAAAGNVVPISPGMLTGDKPAGMMGP